MSTKKTQGSEGLPLVGLTDKNEWYSSIIIQTNFLSFPSEIRTKNSEVKLKNCQGFFIEYLIPGASQTQSKDSGDKEAAAGWLREVRSE